jgi:hypothetical protein
LAADHDGAAPSSRDRCRLRRRLTGERRRSRSASQRRPFFISGESADNINTDVPAQGVKLSFMSTRTGEFLLATVGLIAATASCTNPGQPVATPPSSSTAPPPSSAPASSPALSTPPQRPGAPDPALGDDDAQIRSAVQALQDAYNTSNWATFKAQLCPAIANQYTDDFLQQQRDRDGLATLLVGSIALTGDTASTIVNPQVEHGPGFALTQGQTVLHMLVYQMQRQSDGWKICSVA